MHPEPTGNQTFPKSARLCSRNRIRQLFAGGRSFYLHPFRVTWMRFPGIPPDSPQVVLMVPKHRFRKAADRNLIRRRMREAYRKNQGILQSIRRETPGGLALSIAYTAKEILDYRLIHGKIILLLQRLTEVDEESAG